MAAEKKDQLEGYNSEGATLYDWVANESLQHKHVMGYSLKTAIGDVKGQKVMEAACGNGAYMEYVYNKGATFVCGVDLCSENLDVCRTNHKAKGIPETATTYIQADLAEAKPYEGGPFDLVIQGCCICYSSNQKQLDGWIQNAYTNLKPGGRLVCLNTRGALPAAAADELNEKFKVNYIKEKEGGSKSFDPARVVFPNGWCSGDYFFLEAATVSETMTKVGFTVEVRPITGDPDYKGDENLKRMVELVPYDLFIATKPEETKDKLEGYNTEGATLYDWVANDSLQHKYVMGYSLKTAIGDVKGQTVMEAACGNGAYMEYVFNKGATFVCGVDLCSENLDVCRVNHKAKGIPITATTYIQADLAVPKAYEGGPFDLVIQGCCICYSSNQKELDGWIQNAYDNLKPGGRLVCLNTRGALPAAASDELNEKFKVNYIKEKEGGSKSFDPARVVFPNGWCSGDYFFLEAATVSETMTKVGFTVEVRPITGDPEYKGDEDLARMVELVPYDLFIATKPAGGCSIM